MTPPHPPPPPPPYTHTAKQTMWRQWTALPLPLQETIRWTKSPDPRTRWPSRQWDERLCLLLSWTPVFVYRIAGGTVSQWGCGWEQRELLERANHWKVGGRRGERESWEGEREREAYFLGVLIWNVLLLSREGEVGGYGRGMWNDGIHLEIWPVKPI